MTDGFSISPFSLPLTQRVFMPKVDPFEGLLGVFADSISIDGEHATCVNGNSKNPGLRDILEVARKIGIKDQKAKDIAEEIKEIIAAYHLRD